MVRKNHSKRTRFEVLARCGFACVYCGRRPPEAVLDLDHAVPLSKGGADEDWNLVAACRDCNQGKRARVYAAPGVPFRTWLRAQVGRNDVVGDLAEDEERTPIEVEPRSYKGAVRAFRAQALRAHGLHRDVIAAIWHAWREWRRGGRMTRSTAATHEDRRRRLQAGGHEHLKIGSVYAGVFYPKNNRRFAYWILDGEPPEELKRALGKALRRRKLPPLS